MLGKKGSATEGCWCVSEAGQLAAPSRDVDSMRAHGYDMTIVSNSEAKTAFVFVGVSPKRALLVRRRRGHGASAAGFWEQQKPRQCDAATRYSLKKGRT